MSCAIGSKTVGREVGRQEDSAALFYSFLSDELKDRVSFQYSAELKSFESAGKTMPMEKVMSIVLRTQKAMAIAVSATCTATFVKPLIRLCV